MGKEWSPKTLTYLMAFSEGFLLSIVILDLMPEGLENSPENGVYILAGFLVLFGFQIILTTHFHFGYEHTGINLMKFIFKNRLVLFSRCFLVYRGNGLTSSR
ncbi:hypothetical protein [Lentibacillus salinarum]|uniref:Uncharacterized protein n=1 Tax=Lentibacillus salinarum TaxID=446820 RepID=A0ABW3ZXN8_9BACI